MKILVTATNYSQYCQAGKRILEQAGCEIVENPNGRPYKTSELKEIVGDMDGKFLTGLFLFCLWQTRGKGNKI